MRYSQRLPNSGAYWWRHGSSVGLPKTMDEASVSDGITSSDPSSNPHFSSFGTVYLPYCSGDDWLGEMRRVCDPWRNDCTQTRTEASGDGSSLWFGGANNFQAAMNLTLWQMAGRLRSVIVTGGSAGGQGAYFLSDLMADRLHALGSPAAVRANPQYGVFTQTTAYRDWRQGRATAPLQPYPSSGNPTGVPPWISNISKRLPTRCLHTLTREERAGPFGDMLCGLTSRVAQSMAVPVFMSLNLFDAWLTGVEEKCCGPFGGVRKVGPASDPHFQYLVKVVAPAVRTAVHNATAGNSANPGAAQRNAAFVPPCIDHGMEWNEATAPVLGGCTHAQAVGAWFFGQLNGGADWEGRPVPTCDAVLISVASTLDELAAFECNKGSIHAH